MAEVESKLAVDHFSQLLMLQNREYGEVDFGDLLDASKEQGIEEKIAITKDIFTNSTSREYMINLERMMKGTTGKQGLVGGGLGSVNLLEKRQ